MESITFSSIAFLLNSCLPNVRFFSSSIVVPKWALVTLIVKVQGVVLKVFMGLRPLTPLLPTLFTYLQISVTVMLTSSVSFHFITPSNFTPLPMLSFW